MKRLSSPTFLCVVLFLLTSPLSAANLTASEAKNHVGESATVCGTAVSVHFAGSSKGTPTFVNLVKVYPNQIFTILIWGEDLPRFTNNPATWEGKRVCATGTIASYQGIPEIVAKVPGQINFQK